MALPTPQPGMLISYSYLWRDQELSGETDGRKARPCAIVVVSIDVDFIRPNREGKADADRPSRNQATNQCSQIVAVCGRGVVARAGGC
jgi:hypothetical protein